MPGRPPHPRRPRHVHEDKILASAAVILVATAFVTPDLAAARDLEPRSWAGPRQPRPLALAPAIAPQPINLAPFRVVTAPAPAAALALRFTLAVAGLAVRRLGLEGGLGRRRLIYWQPELEKSRLGLKI